MSPLLDVEGTLDLGGGVSAAKVSGTVLARDADGASGTTITTIDMTGQAA